jgi:cytochrome c oxidase subunit 3
LNTFILLSSGITITYAHHALIQGNRIDSINGTFFTIILALIFTALQYVEYNQAMFTFSDSVYGSVFFASTGLHGLHIIIGTLFLSIGFIRMIFYHLTIHHHAGYEAAILY